MAVKKGKSKSKFILLIVLIAALGVISIVYAALSTTLKVQSGGASITPWIVQFQNGGTAVTNSSSTDVKAGTATVTSTNKTNDTLNISGIVFRKYSDYLEYEFVTQNSGKINAKLTSYSLSVTSGNTTVQRDVVATLSTSSGGSALTSTGSSILTLNAGNTRTMYLKIKYKDYSSTTSNATYTSTALPTSNIDFSVKLTLNWEQA